MPPQLSAAQGSRDLHEDKTKHPKRPSKRKQQVQMSAIIMSQDDARDEVMWKVSPTSERLQSAAGGEPPRRGLREGQLVLQPCQNLQNRCDSGTGTANSAKKKKSPSMAGKLELWLSSSQRVESGNPAAPVDGQDADKENCLQGGSVVEEPKRGSTPSSSKIRGSASKRQSTSCQRRSSTQKTASNGSSKSATKQPGQRRKALLDLLDKVDDALVVKSPALVQTRISFSRKPISPEKFCVAPESRETSEPDKIGSGLALPPSPSLPSIHKVEDPTVPEKSGSGFAVPLVPLSASIHKAEDPTVPGQVGSASALPPSRPPAPFLKAECSTVSAAQRHSIADRAQVHKQVQMLDIRTGSTDFAPLPSSPTRGNSTYPDPMSSGTLTSQQCKTLGTEPVASKNLGNFQLLVLEVQDGQHITLSSMSYSQKSLRLLDEERGYERIAQLRDSWVHAVVQPGDTVNVIGAFDADGICVIDRHQNLIVINPDVLVSGSKVGSSFACPRRAVLDERIKSNEASHPALMGTMLHQLFQVALRSESPSSSLLSVEAQLIVQRNLDGLYAVGVSDREASVKLGDSIPTILGWWRQFVHTKVQVPGAQEIEFGRTKGRQPVSVTEIMDIEETIWSPKYGLKGVIDAAVAVKLGNMSLEDQHQIMPLEFKTGRATTGQAATEHRAQVMLYTLLMSDRYSQAIEGGLLYYLHTNQTEGVEFQHTDLAGLMTRRNEHASSLVSATSNHSLPPMLKNYRMCQGCRHLDSCMLYHKAQDGGTGESSGLKDLFERSTDYLSQSHIDFFQKWDHLIDLESQNILMSHSEIWTMPSRKREEQGRCISSLVLDASSNNSGSQQTSENSFLYSFQRDSSFVDRSSQVDCTQASASFQDKSFASGDYVLLSTESGHVAVAGGYIATVSDKLIVLRLSHRLRVPGKLEAPRKSVSSQILWRIDKDDSASSLAIMRFNLLQLFVKTDGDAHLRSVIVDLQAPKFESVPVGDLDPPATYLRSVKHINEDQSRAVQRIISARDFALILGMPGTGKTSTIVHAVIALLARNSSVLLTSYTNSALDNILLKLKALGVDFLRIGRIDAIHPELREKALGGGVTVKSVEEFQSVVEKAQVVGVTCLGITHALFSKRKFDVCIVDEAGQITLPVCLGPIRCANTFVLVGDHYQLPPLVQSAEAKEKGMTVSLFRRLSEAHPQSIAVLRSQYRMCSDIMALSNSLIYGNRLRCGSREVANASLDISKISRDLPPWLLQVVNPERRLHFLDTDNLSAEESRMRNNIKNTTEASILLSIVRVLCDGGVDTDKIGVISPYKAQANHIQRMAINAGFLNLEVHTVDKYQGREKDCVIISFVRSNSQRHISGSLLSDWHRINVAITRAKTKLVMIGSQNTLSSTPILKLLIQKVAEVGCLLPLPPNTNINAVW